MRACVRARPPSSSSSSSSSSPLVFSFSSSLYPRFSLFFGIPFTTSSRPSSSPTDPTQPLRSSCSLNSSFETLPHQLAIYSRYLYVGIYEQIIIGGMFRHFSAKLLLFILRYPADRDRTVSAGINELGIRGDAPEENVFITCRSPHTRSHVGEDVRTRNRSRVSFATNVTNRPSSSGRRTNSRQNDGERSDTTEATFQKFRKATDTLALRVQR